ncbi:Sporulation lipoprotein [compost metagenome]
MRGAKVVSLSLSAALLAGTVGLTACGNGTGTNNVKTQSVRNNDGRYNVNSLPQNRMFTRNTNGQQNKINSMRYSAALSNRVAQLKEVQSAHVVVTDRDAYVAITRHGSHNGITTHGAGVTTRSNGLASPNHGTIANGVTNRGTTNVSGPYGADYGTRGIADNGLAGSSSGILGPIL